MIDAGSLLICPQCIIAGKRMILGSVSIDGDFYVKRNAREGATTIIKASKYTVVCLCGFGTTVNTTNSGKALPLKNL